MVGNYLRVSNSELEEFMTDSSKLEARIYDDDSENDKSLISVDKSWEALFFVATGNSMAGMDTVALPLRWLLDPPQEIDPEQDLGYGPASYTTSEQTKEINSALLNLSASEIRTRYDGKKMNQLDIYPGGWDQPGSLEYVTDYFNCLKDFYGKAAEENQAVIFFVN